MARKDERLLWQCPKCGFTKLVGQFDSGACPICGAGMTPYKESGQEKVELKALKE